MKTLIAVLVFLLSCAGSPRACQAQKKGQTDPANPLTLKEVHLIEKRIPHLKKGMSPDEVFKTLHLNREHLFGDAGGPTKAFHISYQLRSDYHLYLVFDYSGGPPGRFSSASLVSTQRAPDK